MFDPYYKWLGIPPEHQPPTYYQLLGLVQGERNAEVIEEAAIRQMTHLRAYQVGPHAKECTRLLNEIAEALNTLVDAAKRLDYDTHLAKAPARQGVHEKQAAIRRPAMSEAVPQPISPGTVGQDSGPVAFQDRSLEEPFRNEFRSRQSSQDPVFSPSKNLPWLMAAGIGFVCFALGIGLTIWLGGSRKESPDRKKAKSVAMANDKANEKTESKPRTGSTNQDGQKEKPPKPSTPMPAQEGQKEKPPEPPAPIPAVTPVAPPSTDRVAVARFLTSTTGTPRVLLQRSGPTDSWQRVRPDSPVNTADTLMSLPGYRSELRLARGVGLTLWGNLPDGVTKLLVLESAVRIHDNPDFDLDLTLDHGRICITNQKPEGPARACVRFNDKSWSEVWELTLQEPGSEVAMELWGIFPPGIAFKDPEGPLAGLGLFVLKGQATLKVRSETYSMKEAPGPALFVWNNVGTTERGPRHLDKDKMPAWTNKLSPQGKDAFKMISAQETLSSKLNGKGAINVILPEMVKEAEPYLRLLGVFCLGATDNLAPLLDALSDESHPEVRLVAIDTLRHWMSLKADHDLKLYQAAESKFEAGPAEIIMTLLHSYSERQRQEPETYETLIRYLKNDALAIRELAYTHLAVLVPEGAKQIPFNPAGPAEQRERAADLWKKLIPAGKVPRKPTN